MPARNARPVVPAPASSPTMGRSTSSARLLSKAFDMRSIVPGLVLVSALALPAWTTAQAAPPETLTLADLANRPERWAPSVTLGRAFDFGGGTQARAGQAVTVVEFNGAKAVVDAGNGLWFGMRPGHG